MKPKKSAINTPFSFELGTDTAAQLLELSSNNPNLSNTDIVEHALKRFDFEKVVPKEEGRRQFSVRLPMEMRTELEKHSEAKKVSVGQLIRLAIEDFVTRSPKKIHKELKHLKSLPSGEEAAFEKPEGNIEKKKKARKSGKKKG